MIIVKFKLKSGEEYSSDLEFTDFAEFMFWLKHEIWFITDKYAFRVDSIESVAMEDVLNR